MKQPTISNRGKNAPISPIHGLVEFVKIARQKGKKIYHINIGNPDFALPDKIQQTAKEKLATLTWLPYPPSRGEVPLLKAWQKYFSDIQVPFGIEEEDMVITAGASDAMVLIAATILDPGDEVLTFEPFYPPYHTYTEFVSTKVKSISLDIDNNYHLPSREVIVNAITPKTKAIFFINPNNPTGTVFDKEEMRMLLDIAIEKNIFLVCDETYRGMAFDGRESLSMLHIAKKEEVEHIIIADSLSKRLNVCGARMGLVLSKNREFVNSAFRFLQGRPFAAYLEQELVTPLLSDSLPYLHWLTKEYQKRRDAFITAFQKETGITIRTPEGAFYAMVTLPIKDTFDFAKWLLTDFEIDDETVMIAPGNGFYENPDKGHNEIRIAYVLNEKDLEKAAHLLAEGIKAYNARG